MMSTYVMNMNDRFSDVVSKKCLYQHLRRGDGKVKIEKIFNDILRYGSQNCIAKYLLHHYRYNCLLLMTGHINYARYVGQMKSAEKGTRTKLFVGEWKKLKGNHFLRWSDDAEWNFCRFGSSTKAQIYFLACSGLNWTSGDRYNWEENTGITATYIFQNIWESFFTSMYLPN